MSSHNGRYNGKPKRRSAADVLQGQPPFDLEAEMGVLGAIMLLPEVCDDIAGLRPEDFYDDSNRVIYEILRDMHDSGDKIDITLLVSRLRTDRQYEKVGGAAYLAKLSSSVPNAAHAVYYAGIVSEKACFRELIEVGIESIAAAMEQSESARCLWGRLGQASSDVLEGVNTSSLATLKTVLHESLERIEARLNGDHDDAISTGYKDLDDVLCGLHKGELIILAARPSMGKTAFALNIAADAAINQKLPTLFVSLEMSRIELGDRLLCSSARVNGQRLRKGTLSTDDRKRLVSKANEIADAPLMIDSPPHFHVSEIAAAARKTKRKHDGLGLIVVDYLQLIEPDNEEVNRQEQVAKMARRLKGLARELEVPVLCLSQLNRQPADSKDHRPKLSHLRESGAIEQDADVVMFVHREEYYHHGDDRAEFAGQAEIIVAKQRNGPLADVELTWEADYARFSDRAAERHSEFDEYAEATHGGEF